jgi:hypothetical protein
MLMPPSVGDATPDPPGPAVDHGRDSFIFPVVKVSDDSGSDANIPVSSQSSLHSADLSASSSSSFVSSHAGPGTRTPRGNLARPSGLSLLLARRQDRESDSQEASHTSSSAPSIAEALPTPTVDTLTAPFDVPHGPVPHTPEARGIGGADILSASPSKAGILWEDRQQTISPRGSASDLTETAPLLGDQVYNHLSYSRNGNPQSEPKRQDGPNSSTTIFHKVSGHVKEAVRPKNLEHVFMVAIRSLPAVILGSLLNILDGVSCGSPQLFGRLN